MSFRVRLMRTAMIGVLLAVAVPAVFAQRIPANWRQIGDAGDWEGTVAMTGMGGSLWSIESDGSLFRTDRHGAYEQIGPAGSFSDATLLEALDGSRAVSKGERALSLGHDPS